MLVSELGGVNWPKELTIDSSGPDLLLKLKLIELKFILIVNNFNSGLALRSLKKCHRVL